MAKQKRFWVIFLSLFLMGSISLGVVAAFLVLQKESVTVYDGVTAVTLQGKFDTLDDILANANITLKPEDSIYPQEPAPALQIQRAQPITVQTSSGTETYWTQQTALGSFLAEANITVPRTAQVSADGRSVPFNQLDQTPLPTELSIEQFVTITIVDNAQRQTIRTAATTVGEALQEAGVTLFASDGVEPAMGNWLLPDMTIQIKRAMPLTIEVDGRSLQTRSHHTDSLAVLAENGIGLIGLDYTVPAAGTGLQSGDTIRVVRVSEDFSFEDEELPFETIYQASEELPIDTLSGLSAGVPGIKRKRIRVRYEDGVEVSRTADGEWIAQEPVHQVIGYGTKITTGVIDTEAGPREYWRVVRMRATAYTAASSGRAADHPNYGITASGLQAGKGIVAIDPNVVPFRSEVFVPGYGIGFAGDTGGGIKGRWIDLGFDDGAIETWNGYTDVYYLTPIPPADQINYLLPQVLP